MFTPITITIYLLIFYPIAIHPHQVIIALGHRKYSLSYAVRSALPWSHIGCGQKYMNSYDVIFLNLLLRNS